MEITPSPHRPAATPWGRLAAVVVVVAPVCLLVLLPTGLGLQRYVMSGGSMDAGPDAISRGTLLFEREVPVDDLRVGDVITFDRPVTGADRKVTHRVVEVRPDGLVTQGDAATAPDPWVLDPPGATLPRVVARVPWAGYAYALPARALSWALLLVSALGLGATAVRGRRPATTEPHPGVTIPIAQSGHQP